MKKEDLKNLLKLNDAEDNAVAVYFKAAELGGATKAQALEAFNEYYDEMESA